MSGRSENRESLTAANKCWIQLLSNIAI